MLHADYDYGERYGLSHIVPALSVTPRKFADKARPFFTGKEVRFSDVNLATRLTLADQQLSGSYSTEFPSTVFGRVFSNPWLGWEQYFENARALFGSWNFVTGKSGVRGENPLFHISPFGKIKHGNMAPVYTYDVREDGTYDPHVFCNYDQDYYSEHGLLKQQSYGDHTTDITGQLPMTYGQEFFTPFQWTTASQGLFYDYGNSGWVSDLKFVVQYAYSCVWNSGGSYWDHKTYVVRFSFEIDDTLPPIEDGSLSSLLVSRTTLDDAYATATWNYTGYADAEDYFTRKVIPWNSTLYSRLDDITSPVEDIGKYGTISDTSTPLTLFSYRPYQGDVNDMLGHYEGRYYHLDHGKSMASFHRMATRINSDLLSSGYLAFNDATEEHMAKLSSNHIEFFAQIEGLTAPLTFVKSLKRLRKGGAVNVVKNFVDIMTEGRLLYSYGIAPTIDDAANVVEGMPAVIAKFKDLYSKQTVYGTYVLPVPESFTAPFEGVKLVTRSKVVIRLNPESLLTAFMPLDSLGLLPVPGNLWDLIPFSFVLDQVTPTGAALDVLDHSIRLTAFDVSSVVTTYKLIYPFNDFDQGRFGFDLAPGSSSSDNVEAGYSMYQRVVSKTPPTILPTRLPMYVDLGINDWITTGSLIYQLAT